MCAGPWSSVARDASRLGRLSLDGAPLYTEAYKWSSYGFERRAATHDGSRVHTSVRTPLETVGLLLTAQVSGRPSAVRLELSPQIRAYPASEIDCTERQWRYPSNMDSSPCPDGVGYCERNCWNWYAPRPFANESSAFQHTSFEFVAAAAAETKSRDGVTVLTFADTLSGAVTAVAVRSSQPSRRNGTSLEWAALPAGLNISIAMAFGLAGEAAAVAALATGWARDMPQAMAQALSDREARFRDVFAGGGSRYSGKLPVLQTDDAQLQSVYYNGVASMLELERTTVTLPHAPPNTSRVFVTGAGANASTNAFFWDQAYCATVLSMLDPQMMRASLLQWMRPELGGKDALAGWGVDFCERRRTRPSADRLRPLTTPIRNPLFRNRRTFS